MFTVLSAQQQIDIALLWKAPQTTKTGENEFITRFAFEGCDYETITTELPVYTHILEVDEFYEDYNLQLKNTLFTTLSSEEDEILKSTLADHIQFHTEQLMSQGKNYLKIQFIPMRMANNQVEKLLIAELHLQTRGATLRQSKDNQYAANSVLANGSWYKVRISQSGMHKVTSSELVAMGFGSSIPVNEIRLYGNGGGLLPEVAGQRVHDDLAENAIKIYDLNNNQFFDGSDYFLFYGQGPVTWSYNQGEKRFKHQNHHYDDYAYYYITVQSGQGKRVAQATAPTGAIDKTITQYLQHKAYEKDSLNLIKSGKAWYGRKFDIKTTHSFAFSFPDINSDSLLNLQIVAAARSSSSSSMSVALNGNTQSIAFGAVSVNSSTAHYASTSNQTLFFPANSTSPNVVLSYYKPNNSSFAWLDFLNLNAWSHLNMSGQQLKFSNPFAVESGKVAEYQLSNTTSNIEIWDITNPVNVEEMSSTHSGSTMHFKVPMDTLKTFCAFSGGFYSVSQVGSVENQNLHALEDIDYVIVTHPDFESVAKKLQTFHTEKSGYKVYVTTPDKVYNEFSSGSKDAAAIRDFMKMLYDKADTNIDEAPRYLLLLGDGSYDNKNRISGNTNYLLSFQSSFSTSPGSSYVSDDFFGILDDGEGYNADGALDIGVGRFPVTRLEQAEDILNKIYRYTATHEDQSGSGSCTTGSINISNMSDWRNMVAFVADDEDGSLHVDQADYLAGYVKTNYPQYNSNKIFLDAYPQITVPGGQRYPDAKHDLLQQVEKGALIVSYTGHGGEVGWAHESVLEVGNILDMANMHNMPAFVTATCEFSRFDDPERVSAGEYVLLNPNGGGIALFTTTRLAYAGSNFELSRGLFSSVFEKIDGEYPAMGDVIRMSKIAANSQKANRNFVLLGDPGLKLSYPEYEVITTHINNQVAAPGNLDTLKALSQVTIKGEIQSNGQILQDFNGVVYPTVYDKEKSFFTLRNDSGSPQRQFELQKNVLYKGKAEVKNGSFEFTFIVPKDIAYNFGMGKISYYAEDGVRDANGAYTSVVIGGSETTVDDDIDGPEISLFVNDSNFVRGSITNENPLLLAYIYDEHGINTTGNGIGHDIVATLDGNTLDPIVLNDYYEADLGSYQSGSVRYPFQNLAYGTHTLSIKVWDIYNNSATATTEFVVAESHEMVIENLMNYPNPFTDRTAFIFDHNQACEDMEVEVYIYDTYGRLVHKLSGIAQCEGYRVSSSLLEWDGRTQNGGSLPSGMYVYQLRVKTAGTDWSAASNKMVLVR